MFRTSFSTLAIVSFSILGSLPFHAAFAQDAAPPVATKSTEVGDASDADQVTRLAEYLNGCKFVGKFTVDGQDNAKTEEYTISKCEKLPEQDMYRLTARIKYGDVDSELPLDLPIRWSANTPVITLDNFWIPAMGTFSARVLLHGDRYAGTWQHGEKGGHMFGKIVKLEP